MFHLYTDDARRVLSVAQRHAKRLQRDAVGIEHLLLALIEYGRGPAEEAFFALNITPSEAWTQFESLTGGPSVALGADDPPLSLPYTPGASHALGLTLEVKRRLGHDYLGAEHLLLAVLRQIDDPWAEPELAGEFLERLGVDLRELRQEVLCRVSTEPERRRVRGEQMP